MKITSLILVALWSWNVLSAPTLPEDLLKLRDPFKRPPIRKSTEAPKSELEIYPTEDFKMIGVVTGPDHLRAMVVDPKGKTHFVAKQTKIGTRKGVITEITPNMLRVREKVQNVFGQVEDVSIELSLPSAIKSENKKDTGPSRVRVTGGS